ncbi:MAG: S8 family serine peptidase, partial [Bacteroidales bacterium]|nr:S8 family serine peptidase [Bacteroidales bacterium]
MKKPFFTLLLVLCFSALFGQSNHRQHVIVMMAERYDDSQLSQKTALMTKEQRRDFVIAERKAFCQASQAQVLDFLEGFKSADMVSDLKTFWSFNGFSCSASDDVIAQLSQRKDVAMIIPDEMRQMIPSNEQARPVSTRDNAWHVDKINAPAVWNYNGSGYTGNGVIIGLIDTGVNYNHIDITNSMWDGGSEFPHHGYDVFYQDLDPMDDQGHGTHTAGILAGQGTAGTQT